MTKSKSKAKSPRVRAAECLAALQREDAIYLPVFGTETALCILEFAFRRAMAASKVNAICRAFRKQM